MNCFVFGFQGTIAEQILKNIQTRVAITTTYLPSNKEAITDFVQQTNFAYYDYVIGMGSYSGRDHEAIRLETQCSNNFRVRPATLRFHAISPSFAPTGPFAYAQGIGNSWCNLVSFMLLEAYPNLNYTFLHIPKSFAITHASREIFRQLHTLTYEKATP